MTIDYSKRSFLKASTSLGVAAATIPMAKFAWAAGKPVEPMNLLTSNASFDPVRPEMGRLIAQACKSIGWDVTLAAEDYNMGINKVFQEKDFDMFIVRWTGRANRVDPETFTRMMFHTDGNYNKWGYNNSSINEMGDMQQKEMDVEKRRTIVKAMQRKLYEDVAASPIVHPSMTNAYREDRLDGVVPQLGEGIGSLWTDLNMSVKSGDGYVRNGQTSALKNLNPVSVTDSNEFKELRTIYDRLIQVGPNGELVPWAATSVKAVDNTTIDIVLRDGMKFHDGNPVTIEDVKFTFEYYKKWKAPFFISSLEKFEDMSITGSNSMRIKLSEPHAPLMINFFAQIFIIPQHIWKDIPEKAGVDDVLNFANDNPIGSGPFRFDYWDRGKELKVSAFDQHFAKPKCAGMIRITYGSHDAMAAAIEAGECDRTRYILKPTLVQDLNKINGIVGKGYASHGWYGFMFNHTRGPLQDRAFREAVDHLVPRDVIREVIMSGFATNGGSTIAPANEYWHEAAIKPRANNVKLAKDILSKAGYSWDSSGTLHYPG
ncbi:ABC transporter substrate-binding protein [Candidatus Puniceispirillum marinum]|uniref:Twin-arginine translocation pathway signal n=1 Tax=Puniceispirillum marinum (strain IMCC1322) TaxID=488538 RepID=D5BU25_PUNMI|nr:ABC transporter substrate-binding protein [Candidatus Puniceispirillum marinum]ADE39772.1 Twin-arginine translocation pathway signal [Candidatus Puniceispirillum marinum IMCC1322]